MNWDEWPAENNSAALSTCGDYVISHRPNEFNVSYRPPGQHHHVGLAMTIEEAKKLADAHHEKNRIHKWATVNREVHEPSDIFLADVIEEIKSGLILKGDTIKQLVFAIDTKRYTEAGRILAVALAALDKPVPIR